MYKEIVQKIIDLLKVNANLLEPDKIRKYYFGEPIKILDYPIIYAEHENDAISQGSTDKDEHLIDVGIVVVTRDADPEKADKDALDFADNIRTVLRADPTLQGLVTDSNIVGARFIAGTLENFAVSGVRSVLRCLKHD